MIHDDIPVPVAPVIVEPGNPIEDCNFDVKINDTEPVTVRIFNSSAKNITSECDAHHQPVSVKEMRPAFNHVSRLYEGEACLCGLETGDIIRIVVCQVAYPTVCTIETREMAVDCDECPERVEKMAPMGNAPVLVYPTETVDSCSFPLLIAADGAVIVEIYDEHGRQITRGCDTHGKPMPVRTLLLRLNPTSHFCEGVVCLCGVRNGSKIRIVTCDLDPAGVCSSWVIQVNHNSKCPPCPKSEADATIVDTVVGELHDVVARRLAEELRRVVAAISPPAPAEAAVEVEAAPNKPGRKRRKTQKESPVNLPKRRGRRRRK